MPRWFRLARALPLWLLPLLAAALACSLSSAAPTPNALTQAAATKVAATDAVAPMVDPCGFISTSEASTLAGAPAAPPRPLTGGGCIYYDTAITTTGVGLYVLPAAHAQTFLGQYVPAFQGHGVPIDDKTAKRFADESAAGDMPAAVNDLAEMTAHMPGYTIQKLAGVGSAALWSWHTLDQNQEGVLLGAQPGALVVMILHGPLDTQSATAQPAMAALVRRILDSLPGRFTVPGLP